MLQTIRVICSSLSPSGATPFNQTTVDGGNPSASSERARRRQQAREAQQRLMKQFALKQKQFLGTVIL